MTREEAHQLVDKLFDAETPAEVVAAEVVARVLPEGKRVVRTKGSGDRVYLLDEVAKTRHWVTNPEVLEGYGFTMADVGEAEDAELLKYQMSAALYKAPSERTEA